MNPSKKNIIYRIILVALLLVSFFLNGFTVGLLTKFQPDDYIFSCVVIAVFTLFGTFELALTLINFKKEPALKKIAYTERGYFNFIPFIAVSLGMLIALGLSITGTCLFFIRTEMTVKSNSLVLLAVGFYLFINCLVYYLYVLLNKK